MLDYLLDRLEAVDEIDGIHVVTNARFAGDFGGWASQRSGLRCAVWNDGTTSNEDRLGAIGDIRFTIEEDPEGEEFVVAGDNLIEYSLEDFVRFWREKGDGVAVHRAGSRADQAVRRRGARRRRPRRFAGGEARGAPERSGGDGCVPVSP